MTQFDPLLHWEDHQVCIKTVLISNNMQRERNFLVSNQAVWKMQYRGSLGEALIHILIMGNSLIHTKIARTLIRQFPRTVIDVIEVYSLQSSVLLTTD